LLPWKLGLLRRILELDPNNREAKVLYKQATHWQQTFKKLDMGVERKILVWPV